MAGMLSIMPRKAVKFTTLKMPTTMYSWNSALTVKVTKRHNDELRPALRIGK